MPITTIKLDAALATASNMGELMAKALEEFEYKLKRENCQVININVGEQSKSFLGRTQVVTVIWSGSSTNIKSSYTAYPVFGVFGVVAANLLPY